MKYVLAILIFLLGTAALAENSNNYIDSIEAIETGILWAVEKVPTKLCKVKKDKTYLRKIAIQIKESSAHFNQPPLLITGMMYRESVFRTTEIGPGGELGLLQVGPMGIRKCKAYCGKMETIKEQVDCGTCWLDMGVKWCKSLEGGFISLHLWKMQNKIPTIRKGF